MQELTTHDLEVIYESLKYSKLNFESYHEYPDESFRKTRVNEVSELMKKIKSLLNNHTGSTCETSCALKKISKLLV